MLIYWGSTVISMRYCTVFCSVILLAACSSDGAVTRSGSGTTGGGATGAPSSGASGSGDPFAGGSATNTTTSSGAAAAMAVGSAGNTGSSTQTSCSPAGSTRGCCGSGLQTCGGVREFPVWGPCIDGKGATLICTGTCGPGEFGPGCDAGIDSGSKCGPGEFGPGCDAGLPPPPALCMDESVSNEPEILAAFSPANGQSVASNGQIKVWINDERAAIIAPNEQIDMNTGLITSPGDRTAKAADGYLWEPALYIAPQTAENGGMPHFPQAIKGWYNNKPPPPGTRPPNGAGVQVPGMDPPPAGTPLPETYTSEDIWDVNALGLPPGTYIGEFVIHDGDKDRAVGCVTIVITATM